MKRTALKRKTPLRAKHWGISKKSTKTTKSNSVLGPTRDMVISREAWRCELCGQPIGPREEWHDHHVFYRSHLSRRVRHELWNRSPLHDPCHRAAHRTPGARYLLEAKAVHRLYEHLGATRIAEVLALMPEGATDPAAFVRAYEMYARRTSTS